MSTRVSRFACALSAAALSTNAMTALSESAAFQDRSPTVAGQRIAPRPTAAVKTATRRGPETIFIDAVVVRKDWVDFHRKSRAGCPPRHTTSSCPPTAGTRLPSLRVVFPRRLQAPCDSEIAARFDIQTPRPTHSRTTSHCPVHAILASTRERLNTILALMLGKSRDGSRRGPGVTWPAVIRRKQRSCRALGTSCAHVTQQGYLS